MKFAPGPWEWKKDGFCELRDSNGVDIIWYTIADDGLHCSEANARLIAAAPDMYEALKNIRNQIPDLYDDYVYDGKLTVTLDADTVDQLFDVLAETERG